MTMPLLELFAMLVIILVAAELFTNALEHLGERLHISEGVTGSIFAAVGTALPETLVPVLAIFVGTADAHLNEEVGVGAILGAPLMLATLSTFLMGMAIVRRRGLTGRITPEETGFKRDLQFFILAFVIAIAAMFVPQEAHVVRYVMSALLVLTYCGYLFSTIRASKKLVEAGHGTESKGQMYLNKLRLPTNLFTIVLQIAIGLVLLVLGAKGFIHGVSTLSNVLGVSALLIALLIIPIATELPEKINSILWIRRGKDTLAFGNITGAMVFQGTLLPAIGITLTPWVPRVEVLNGALITMLAVLWLRLFASKRGVPVWVLLVNGLLYVCFIYLALY